VAHPRVPNQQHFTHDGIMQDPRTGKWEITGHAPLRGLLFARRRDAEAFLVRVRQTETNLERALRLAVEAVK
jgi:hypothetical protein